MVHQCPSVLKGKLFWFWCFCFFMFFRHDALSGWPQNFQQDSSSHLPHAHHLPRMLLVEMGFFGEDQEGLQKKLDSAYRHFKAYISAEKIPCSQGPFTVKMVARHVITTGFDFFNHEIYLKQKRPMVAPMLKVFVNKRPSNQGNQTKWWSPIYFERVQWQSCPRMAYSLSSCGIVVTRAVYRS